MNRAVVSHVQVRLPEYQHAYRMRCTNVIKSVRRWVFGKGAEDEQRFAAKL
jgi:hypothetical protein